MDTHEVCIELGLQMKHVAFYRKNKLLHPIRKFNAWWYDPAEIHYILMEDLTGVCGKCDKAIMPEDRDVFGEVLISKIHRQCKLDLLIFLDGVNKEKAKEDEMWPPTSGPEYDRIIQQLKETAMYD